jgi:hypothetical protein
LPLPAPRRYSPTPAQQPWVPSTAGSASLPLLPPPGLVRVLCHLQVQPPRAHDGCSTPRSNRKSSSSRTAPTTAHSGHTLAAPTNSSRWRVGGAGAAAAAPGGAAAAGPPATEAAGGGPCPGPSDSASQTCTGALPARPTTAAAVACRVSLRLCCCAAAATAGDLPRPCVGAAAAPACATTRGPS